MANHGFEQKRLGNVQNLPECVTEMYILPQLSVSLCVCLSESVSMSLCVCV